LSNPACKGPPLTGSAVVDCGLTGKFIGLFQDNSLAQNYSEVRAYPWKDIATTMTTNDDLGCYLANCSEYGAQNAIDGLTWFARNNDGGKALTANISKPYFKYHLGAEKFIKAALVIGRTDPCCPDHSRNWILFVGNDDTNPSGNTACTGGDDSAGQEVVCNALGRYVYI